VCADGQYLDGSICKDCGAGTYSVAGATRCTECAAGTYAPNPKSKQCLPCDPPKKVSTDRTKCENAVGDGKWYTNDVNHQNDIAIPTFTTDVDNFILKWRKVIPPEYGTSPNPMIILGNGNLYLADYRCIYAYDQITAEYKWGYFNDISGLHNIGDPYNYGSYTLSNSFVKLPPRLVYDEKENSIYTTFENFKTETVTLYSFDATTGDPKWSQNILPRFFGCGLMNMLLGTNSKLYLITNYARVNQANTIYAHDAKSGINLWTYDSSLLEKVHSSRDFYDNLLTTFSVLGSDNVIYRATYRTADTRFSAIVNRIVANDPNTGNYLWSIDFDHQDVKSLIWNGNYLYLTTIYTIYCIKNNGTSGSIVWQKTYSLARTYGTPSGTFYLGPSPKAVFHKDGIKMYINVPIAEPIPGQEYRSLRKLVVLNKLTGAVLWDNSTYNSTKYTMEPPPPPLTADSVYDIENNIIYTPQKDVGNSIYDNSNLNNADAKSSGYMLQYNLNTFEYKRVFQIRSPGFLNFSFSRSIMDSSNIYYISILNDISKDSRYNLGWLQPHLLATPRKNTTIYKFGLRSSSETLTVSGNSLNYGSYFPYKGSTVLGGTPILYFYKNRLTNDVGIGNDYGIIPDPTRTNYKQTIQNILNGPIQLPNNVHLIIEFMFPATVTTVHEPMAKLIDQYITKDLVNLNGFFTDVTNLVRQSFVFIFSGPNRYIYYRQKDILVGEKGEYANNLLRSGIRIHPSQRITPDGYFFTVEKTFPRTTASTPYKTLSATDGTSFYPAKLVEAYFKSEINNSVTFDFTNLINVKSLQIMNGPVI